MNKIYGIIALLGLGFSASAQQSGPILFKDAAQAFEQSIGNEGAEITGKPGEGQRYHYERWKWYWEQHQDQNGYMVPPAANYQEAMRVASAGLSKTTADNSNWVFQGPTTSPGGYNGIGRINVIEFHPTNGNTYWVGASGGGIWKTTDDGQTWSSLSNNLPRLDISDIDVNPQNPNTIYVCTGDRDGGSQSYNNNFSVGVLKSFDGGTTWNTTGLTWNTSAYDLTNCLLINPNDTNSLLLATNVGIQRSTNGGANWTVVQTGHYKQIVYHPTNPSIVYAARYDGNTQVYRSTDGGINWSAVTNINNGNRIALAVSAASPNLVRAAVCNSSNGLQEIIESTNSGASFTRIYAPTGSSCNTNSSNVKIGDLITSRADGKGCGKQGWYDLAFIISPTNSNTMFLGGVNTWGSTDGGRNWTIRNQWTTMASGLVVVHADKHWYGYSPHNGALYECNDGGLYKSLNPFSNLWNDLTNGMGITQFYRNAVTNAATYVLAGSQDNGSKGVQGGIWYELTGGDGMNCEADPLDSNVFYTAIQNGELRRTTNGGNSFTDISNNIPSDPEGSWITPYIINPNNNQELIAGYKHVYYSPDRGDSWTSIQGSEVSSELFTRVAMTLSSKPTIYALAPNDKVVYYVDNYIAGQQATFDTIQVPYNGYISDIKVHPTDSGRFYISFAAYNGAKVAEYNKGVWSQRNTGLPNVPVRCIEFDTSRLDIMYVGTDLGVYYMDSSTNGVWATFQKNMPFIEVTDLGINYTTKEIWAATYGRGLWSSVKQGSVPTPPDTTDTTTSIVVIPYAEDVFSIAPNPAKDNFKIIAGPSIASGKAIRVNIIDYTGKVVIAQNAEFNGDKEINIQAENIPAGIYIVELANNETVLGRKRVVIQ